MRSGKRNRGEDSYCTMIWGGMGREKEKGGGGGERTSQNWEHSASLGSAVLCLGSNACLVRLISKKKREERREKGELPLRAAGDLLYGLGHKGNGSWVADSKGKKKKTYHCCSRGRNEGVKDQSIGT